MKLLSVEGSNIGLLKGPFNMNFNGSLTAITGPIGVGKSTLLTIIKASLTNSVPGSGASWVSWGSGKDEPSYFKAVWSLGDTTVEIVKPMVDSVAFKELDLPRIRVSDFEDNVLFESFTSSGAAEILQTILPVTSKVVDTHLVVDQDAISHPTTATPAKFQETLHTLTRVNDIEKVRIKMRESLNSYTVPEVSELLETVNKDISELESELAQKVKEKGDVDARLLSVDPQQISDKIIAAEELKRTEERRSKLLIDIKETMTHVDRLDIEKKELTFRMNELSAELKSHEAQNTLDQQYVSAYTQLKAMWDKQQKVLTEIEGFETSLELLITPVKVDDAPDETLIPPLVAKRARLEVESDVLSSSIKVCESGICPTCLQSTENIDVGSLQSRQTYIQNTLIELGSMLNTVNLKVEEYKAYRQALQGFELEKNRITTEIDSRKSALDLDMEPVVESKYEEASMRQLTYKSWLDSKANIAASLQAISSREEIYTQNLERFKADIPKFESNETVFNPLEYQTLVEVQTLYQEDKTKSYSLGEGVRDKQSQIYKLEERKKSVEDRAAQANPVIKYRETLNKSIEILKKDNLPRLLSSQYLGEINEKLQMYLNMLDAQFIAWIDDDLNFMVRKSDGLVHKANRLSGGQKQQASISYLLAVNDVFASSLGVLILDEPTGSMQEDNAKDVAEAFGKLLQIGKATNRQFIVVTHSKSLAAYSDQIIEMPIK